ncbi:MAG: hypothetical protein A2148_04195 [Chloroflexi bacterium RBG_16_68_14]|nr:MAG: hypothetical protein A2148_04195 [Chloroflexi bacterium RBG_16_68_14]
MIPAGNLDDERTWRAPIRKFKLSKEDKKTDLRAAQALAAGSLLAIARHELESHRAYPLKLSGSLRIEAELVRESAAPEQFVAAICDALKNSWEWLWDLVDELELPGLPDLDIDIEIPLGPAGSDYKAATERLRVAADQYKADVLDLLRSLDYWGIVRGLLPSPVAVVYAQIDKPRTIHEKFFATVAAFEAAVRYLAVLSLIPVAGQTREARLRTLAGELGRRPTLGVYVKTVGENLHRLEGLLPEVTQALRTRSGKHTALGRFVFDELTKMRNQYVGHAAPMPQAAYVEPYQRLRRSLDGLLAALARDERSTALVVPASWDFSQAEGDYDYTLTELRGDSVRLPTKRLVTKERLEADKVYLWRRKSGAFIDADPLIIYAMCPQCHFEEGFFLDRFDPKAAQWLSYRANHRIPKG